MAYFRFLKDMRRKGRNEQASDKSDTFWAHGLEKGHGNHDLTIHNSQNNSFARESSNDRTSLSETACTDARSNRITELEEELRRCTRSQEEALDEIHRLRIKLEARDESLEIAKVLTRAAHQVRRNTF